MRSIDADALVAELKWLQSQVSSTSAMEIAEYIDRINAQPTVDAVEVVRCKDCKYSYGSKYCTNEAWKDEGNTVTIEPDAFCSYGEKRNEHET